MSRLHIDKLPDDTRALFEFIGEQREIEDRFVLIGGTAITLHHGHRRSEDLDFRATTLKLPRRELGALLEKIERRFERPLLSTSEEAIEDWENEVGDLLDYQQDYTVDRVKLTFFADHDETKSLFVQRNIGARFGAISILSSEALFELKARLIFHRTRSRDLFDLWFYLSSGLRSMDDLVEIASDETRGRMDWEGIRQRLLPVGLQSNDPGFEGLVSAGPRTFEDLTARLRAIADEYEQTRKLDQISSRLK